jgi:hypothetical protein
MNVSRLNRDLLKQTLRGYEEVNRITEAERRARLPLMTIQESLEAFTNLYDVWHRTGRLAGGNLAALEQRQYKHLLQQRRTFVRLAKKQGKNYGKPSRRRMGSR